MTARARVTCWTPSARVKSFWLIGPTTVTLFEGFDGPWRLGQRQANARKVHIPAFSPYLYCYRNFVERFFSKIKHFRAVATRFVKHDLKYLAVVKLAAARIWMRFMSR